MGINEYQICNVAVVNIHESNYLYEVLEWWGAGDQDNEEHLHY